VDLVVEFLPSMCEAMCTESMCTAKKSHLVCLNSVKIHKMRIMCDFQFFE
jgi:hypothetical protein